MPPRAFDRLHTSVAQTVPELQRAQFRGVQKSALQAKTLVLGEIRRVAGPDLRLSGAGRGGRGARVGARYDIKGTTNPTALIYPLGPIQLVERDTSAHVIRPRAYFTSRGGKRVRMGYRSAKGRRYSGGKTVLRINGSPRSGPVRHPGTRGQEPFGKGAKAAARVTPRIFNEQVEAGLRKAGWGS